MTPIFVDKWESEYPMIKEYFTNREWRWIFKISRIALNTKMQSLQYKIITGIINCGKKLMEWHIKDNNKCTLCGEVDDIQHYLIYCDSTSKLWTSFSHWWNKIIINWGFPRFNIGSYDTEELIIFGFYGKDVGSNVLNYCVLYVKMFIHMAKQLSKNINFYDFLPRLKEWLKLDKANWKIKPELNGLKLLYSIL